MDIRSSFKKAVGYLAENGRSYTLHGAFFGENNKNTNVVNQNYFALLALPLNRGGRLAERTIAIGGTAVAAFALAAAPVTMLSATSFIGYAALSKVAGLVTGAFVDTGVNNLNKKLRQP